MTVTHFAYIFVIQILKYKHESMNNKIEISSKFKNQLAEEFETSLQSVQMSLNYVFNSEQAKKIRGRAKELLQAEITKINENETA